MRLRADTARVLDHELSPSESSTITLYFSPINCSQTDLLIRSQVNYLLKINHLKLRFFVFLFDQTFWLETDESTATTQYVHKIAEESDCASSFSSAEVGRTSSMLTSTLQAAPALCIDL
jgi:hypothetical protein